MNLQKTIRTFIDSKRTIIFDNLNNLNESQLKDLYLELFNKVDYRASWSEVLQTSLSETIRAIDSTGYSRITDKTYLKFASLMIETAEYSEFDSVQLLYSIIGRAALENKA